MCGQPYRGFESLSLRHIYIYLHPTKSNCSLPSERRPILSATIHPDLKRTLVAMSERTGMSVSQVADEVLYTGLVEMQEMDELE